MSHRLVTSPRPLFQNEPPAPVSHAWARLRATLDRDAARLQRGLLLWGPPPGPVRACKFISEKIERHPLGLLLDGPGRALARLREYRELDLAGRLLYLSGELTGLPDAERLVVVDTLRAWRLPFVVSSSESASHVAHLSRTLGLEDPIFLPRGFWRSHAR